MLKANRHHLDLSSLQLDGSHRPAKKQGEHNAYQDRKAARTTNALFLTDKYGLPLGMATPQAGNHHDLFNIDELFGQLCTFLQEAEIALNGIFMNADAGFDAVALRSLCAQKGIEANIAFNPSNEKQSGEEYVHFDDELYKERSVIERTNAWLDGFKTLLVRYETKVETWIADHYMAFATIFLRKVRTC